MKTKKQRCSKCGAGLNDTHHWYDCGDGMYCEDCFKDWVREYLDSNPEDIAPLMNVPVWDVMEKEICEL